MQRGLRKPADAFRPGDRLILKGQIFAVQGWRYVEGRRSVELAVVPENGGTEDRMIFPSGESLELAPPLNWIQRTAKRLRR